MMFNALKNILVGDAEQPAPPSWELAVAVLLFEVARADFNISSAERDVIARMIATEYALSAETVNELMIEASEQVDEQISMHPFLRQVNDSFSAAQRQHLIELMWRVALAEDGKHRFEEALIRRVADLVYVEHSRFIRAKLDAQSWVDAQGGDDSIMGDAPSAVT